MTNQCLNAPSPKMSRLINEMPNGVVSTKLVDQKSKFVYCLLQLLFFSKYD